MSFAFPWGLLALLGVPAVLWLHKLRRRLRERRVAGLFLFAPEAMKEDAGRTISPLLRTASLWLELAGAVLLALLLAGPRLFADRPPAHLVVVLDDTASMDAAPEGRSVLEEARRHAKDRVAALASDARVSLVRTGRPPETLAGPRASRAAALAALDRWNPVRAAHDPGPALDLALELAGPEDGVLFVTDEAEPDVPAGVEVAAFGRAADNAALSSARRFASGDHETLAVDVVAHARAPVATEVSVRAGADGDGPVLAARPVVVDPARPLRLTIDVPPSDLPLRVSLSSDPLALDGVAVLLPERPRVVPYAVDMTLATVAALGLNRLRLAVPGITRVEPEAAALVFAETDGPARPGSMRVVVSAAGTERDDWLGPFLLDRGNALVDGLTLEGVVWSSGRGPLPGRGLAFAGEKALLSEEVSDGATVVRLDLDPARSTLEASADWPILLSNLVERARSSLPGPAAVNVRIGQPLLFRTESPVAVVEGLKLVSPLGAEEPARGRGLLVFEPREPGVHRLVGPSGEVARFAVAFVDGRESDLRARGSSRRPARRREGTAVAARGDDGEGSNAATRVLALLLLGVVAADMGVLSRRTARPSTPLGTGRTAVA